MHTVGHVLALLDPLAHRPIERHTEILEHVRATKHTVHRDFIIRVLFFDRRIHVEDEREVSVRDGRGSGENIKGELLSTGFADGVKCEGDGSGECLLDSLDFNVAVKDVGGAERLEELGVLCGCSGDDGREAGDASQLDS